MGNKQTKTMIILMIFLFVIIKPNIAHAYVDPGTGTLMFQLLIAALVGAIFVLKNIRLKIVGFIKSLFRSNGKE